MVHTMNGNDRFTFIGNHLALDFVNTRLVVEGQLTDLLDAPEAINAWAKAVGLPLTAPPSGAQLARFTQFREQLLSLFRAVIEMDAVPEGSLGAINRYLASASSEQKLSVDGEGFLLGTVSDRLTPDQLLGRIALAAAELLASSQRDRLRRCANHQCVLLFLDTSRPGKRRWCSMETCGNRAKVKKHYEKEKGRGE